MSVISLTTPSRGANVNKTSTYLPYNKAGVFDDSLLTQPADGVIKSVDGYGQDNGIYLDTSSLIYKLGAYNPSGNGTRLELNDTLEIFLIKARNIEVQGTIATGVHVASGNYLAIKVNGSNYVIQLLNP